MKRLIVCMMVCLTSLQCMKHRVMHPDGVFSFEADERVFAANALDLWRRIILS